MITIFLLFSSYMCWKIEEKYDTMRSKATVTKSFKQQKIDEENERIEKYLKRNEFRSIPIKTEEEDDEQYQYKQEGEFDTKEYLL